MRKIFGLALLLMSLAACSSDGNSSIDISSLPTGDIARGETLFQESINGAPACSTCHTLDGNTLVGPSLQAFGERAATMVEGQSAEEYTLNSILHPSQYLVEGFANVMYPNYSVKLDAQQQADLLVFLLNQ